MGDKAGDELGSFVSNVQRNKYDLYQSLSYLSISLYILSLSHSLCLSLSLSHSFVVAAQSQAYLKKRPIGSIKT